MDNETLDARRAIESLRSGVPSLSVAKIFGTTQTAVRDKFLESMEDMTTGNGVKPIMLSASFGSGKTHLLNYLQLQAESKGFVTSIVTISPEMPLGKSANVLKSISENARAPHTVGRALTSLAFNLKPDSSKYQKLEDWAADSGIETRFLALLRLYGEFYLDEELRQAILDDFEGKTMPKPDIKRKLKEIGIASLYDLNSPKGTQFSHDRIRLLAQFYKACGCSGWIIFFDEMERMAKFSLKQRIAAYQELGWWRDVAATSGSAILPVFTTASGFALETVTGGTNDEARFSKKGDEVDKLALRGIELLKSAYRLNPPTDDEVHDIYSKARELYEKAYSIPISDVKPYHSDVRTTVRFEIRRWITTWDLKRLHPDYDPDITIKEVQEDQIGIFDDVMDDDLFSP